jgi:alginate O-acetyltransferase complex protein AlgJ
MGRKPFMIIAADVVLALAFSVLLCLPLVGGVLGWDVGHDLGEKRVLAKCPVLGQDPVVALPEKFEAFYQDHFGFRTGLIRGHNWVRYKLCQGSSFGKVLFGKDGWLFLTRSGILPDFLGQNPMTAAELDAWKETLEGRQRWLSERGIHYLFVIAPNKATIYPEELPDHIQRGRGRSRMDQLLNHLRDHSAMDVIDLRPALLEGKTAGLTYHPRDSHWTDRGAFIAYEQICRRLGMWFADIQPLSIDSFELAKAVWTPDLSTLLGLGEELAEEAEVWVPKTPRTAKAMVLTVPAQHAGDRTFAPGGLCALENPHAKHRLVMFHDSFGVFGGLREYIGEHFYRAVFVSGPLNAQSLEWLVEQEHPDIILEEIVERKLRDVPSDSSEDNK